MKNIIFLHGYVLREKCKYLITFVHVQDRHVAGFFCPRFPPIIVALHKIVDPPLLYSATMMGGERGQKHPATYGHTVNITAIRPYGQTAIRPNGHTAKRPTIRPPGRMAVRPAGQTAIRPDGRWPSFFLWCGRMAGRLDFLIRPPALIVSLEKVTLLGYF